MGETPAALATSLIVGSLLRRSTQEMVPYYIAKIVITTITIQGLDHASFPTSPGSPRETLRVIRQGNSVKPKARRRESPGTNIALVQILRADCGRAVGL
jgi:hypothetical protein